MQIDEAVSVQKSIMAALEAIAVTSAAVSEFIDGAIEVAYIYGEDSPVVTSILEAGNLGPKIDHEVNRMRLLLLKRLQYMVSAQQNK